MWPFDMHCLFIEFTENMPYVWYNLPLNIRFRSYHTTHTRSNTNTERNCQVEVTCNSSRWRCFFTSSDGTTVPSLLNPNPDHGTNKLSGNHPQKCKTSNYINVLHFYFFMIHKTELKKNHLVCSQTSTPYHQWNKWYSNWLIVDDSFPPCKTCKQYLSCFFQGLYIPVKFFLDRFWCCPD